MYNDPIYTMTLYNNIHIAMCLRVLRDALVSGGHALLQAKGLWLEQIII